MDNGAGSYRRFLEGDDNGMAEIVREYKDGLIFYLNGYVSDLYLAEELAEDTFFKLMVKRPHYTARYSFKTWLYTIGRNVAIDHLRRYSRTVTTPLEEHEHMLGQETDFETVYLKEERKIFLHRVIAGLRTEYRQALCLVYFEGLDNGEAAHAMRKTKHQMETLLYRARKSLKAQLEKEGFVYEEL